MSWLGGDPWKDDNLMAKPDDYPDGQRDFDTEDVQHLDDFIDLVLDVTSATSLPGLESIRDQIAVRLSLPTRFDDD